MIIESIVRKVTGPNAAVDFACVERPNDGVTGRFGRPVTGRCPTRTIRDNNEDSRLDALDRKPIFTSTTALKSACSDDHRGSG